MKEVMTQIFFGIVAIAAFIGIKMMDLPLVIAGLLVLIIFLAAIYGISGGFSKTSLQKRNGEKSSIHQTAFNTQSEK